MKQVGLATGENYTMSYRYRVTYTNGDKCTLSAVNPGAAKLLALALIKLCGQHIEKIEQLD